MYNEMRIIQKLLWKNDDLMDQDTLFVLQDMVCKLTLEIAQKENKIDDLIKSFPFLYERSFVNAK